MKNITKFFLLISIGTIILISCLYFFITSEYFLQKFLIPEIGFLAGGKAKAKNVIFSPLSSDLKVNDIEIYFPGNFSLKAKTLSIDVDPLKLIFNKIYIDSLVMKDVYIDVGEVFVKNRYSMENISKDYKSNNYLPFTSYKLDLNNIKLNNLNIKYKFIHDKQKKPSEVMLEKLNINIPLIKSGIASICRFSGTAKFNSENKIFSGNFSGISNMTLSEKNKLEILKTNLKLLYQNNNESEIFLKYNYADDNSNNLYANINNLPLTPFYRILIDGEYDNFDSVIENLQLNFKNIFTSNVSGDIQASINNYTVPLILDNYDFAKPLFIPIKLISSISINSKILTYAPRLENAVKFSDDVKDGIIEVDFGKSNIELKVYNDKIEIVKALFTGRLTPLNKVHLSGVIYNNKKIILNSEIIYNGLIIPMSIKGSLYKPKINLKEFSTELIKSNTKEFKEENSTSTDAIRKVEADTADHLSENLSSLTAKPSKNIDS